MSSTLVVTPRVRDLNAYGADYGDGPAVSWRDKERSPTVTGIPGHDGGSTATGLNSNGHLLPPPAFAIPPPPLKSFVRQRGPSDDSDAHSDEESDMNDTDCDDEEAGFNASRGKGDVSVHVDGVSSNAGGVGVGGGGGGGGDGGSARRGSGAQEMEEEARQGSGGSSPARALSASMPASARVLKEARVRRSSGDGRSGVRLSDARSSFIGGAMKGGGGGASQGRKSSDGGGSVEGNGERGEDERVYSSPIGAGKGGYDVEADEMAGEEGDEESRRGLKGRRSSSRMGRNAGGGGGGDNRVDESYELRPSSSLSSAAAGRRGTPEIEVVCYDSAGDWGSDGSDGLPAVLAARKLTGTEESTDEAPGGASLPGSARPRSSLSMTSDKEKDGQEAFMAGISPAVGQSAGESALEEEPPAGSSGLAVGEGTAAPPISPDRMNGNVNVDSKGDGNGDGEDGPPAQPVSPAAQRKAWGGGGSGVSVRDRIAALSGGGKVPRSSKDGPDGRGEKIPGSLGACMHVCMCAWILV